VDAASRPPTSRNVRIRLLIFTRINKRITSTNAFGACFAKQNILMIKVITISFSGLGLVGLFCSASLRNCSFDRLSGRRLILSTGIPKLLLPVVFLAFTVNDSFRYVPIAYRMAISQTLCILESALSYALRLIFCCRVLFIQNSGLLGLGFRSFLCASWRFAETCRLHLQEFKVFIKILDILKMKMNRTYSF
jgi:hypothetical protein